MSSRRILFSHLICSNYIVLKSSQTHQVHSYLKVFAVSTCCFLCLEGCSPRSQKANFVCQLYLSSNLIHSFPSLSIFVCSINICLINQLKVANAFDFYISIHSVSVDNDDYSIEKIGLKFPMGGRRKAIAMVCSIAMVCNATDCSLYCSLAPSDPVLPLLLISWESLASSMVLV